MVTPSHGPSTHSNALALNNRQSLLLCIKEWNFRKKIEYTQTYTQSTVSFEGASHRCHIESVSNETNSHWIGSQLAYSKIIVYFISRFSVFVLLFSSILLCCIQCEVLRSRFMFAVFWSIYVHFKAIHIIKFTRQRSFFLHHRW